MPRSRDNGRPAEADPAAIGGPIYRLYHRYAPGRPPSADIWLRVLLVPAVAWLPVAMLAFLSAGREGMPFLLDLEVHLKLLVALPILMLADRLAQPRLLAAAAQFAERDVVPVEQRARLDAALARMARSRDSLALELIVLAIVYTAGHWIWREQIALASATWYASPSPGGPELTGAGLWYTFASAPIFRFLLFLWYARIILWFRFLWTVARLDLRLVPTHPDRAAGLAFVGNSLQAFLPFLAAQGVLLAGMIANRIFHEGQPLAAFKVDAVGLVAFVLAFLLVPLLVFSPKLARARRQGLREYGALASRYVREFDEKWIRAAGPGGEPLVGSADIQSLADLDNSFAVVREMRSVPFSSRIVYRLAIAVVAPLLPLSLTVFPLEELLDRLVQILL